VNEIPFKMKVTTSSLVCVGNYLVAQYRGDI